MEQAELAGQVVEHDPGVFFLTETLGIVLRRSIPCNDHGLELKTFNAMHGSYADPGFGGVDVPAQGITAMLTWVQEL